MRVIEWAFVKKHLRRIPTNELDVPQANGDANGQVNDIPNGHAALKKSSPHECSPTLSGILWDACDLSFNMRGHGWNWAQGWYFPPETRPTSSTPVFLASTLASAIKHTLLFDLMLSTVRSLSPSTYGSPVGGTIYDPSLPPLYRYSQSTLITVAGGIAIYATIHMVYDSLTIICIIILRQHPTQWPPVFDSPWLSTSVTSCWGQRWHQIFRGSFVGIGARPLSVLIGRVGGVMGAFFWSAILHDFGLWGMGKGTDFWSAGLFFLMMGVGVIVEALFKKATGRKVGGWAGWLWTMGWVVGWGTLLVDCYARLGLVGRQIIPEGYRPSQILLPYIHGYPG